MLCLWVIVPQIFYDIIYILHRNITVGPEDALLKVLQWQNMHVPAFPSKMTIVLMFVVQ